MATPADAVARFQHDDGKPGVFQRMRGTETGRARPDDRNVDGRGEGHGGALACRQSTLKPAKETGVIAREAGDPVFQRR